MYWVRRATHLCISCFFFSPSVGTAAFTAFFATFAPSVNLAGSLEAVEAGALPAEWKRVGNVQLALESTLIYSGSSGRCRRSDLLL